MLRNRENMNKELDEYLEFRKSEVEKILCPRSITLSSEMGSKEERALEFIFGDIKINRIKQTLKDIAFIERLYYKYFSKSQLLELNYIRNEIEQIDSIIDDIINVRKRKYCEIKFKKKLNISNIKECLSSDNVVYKRLYKEYDEFKQLEKRVVKYTLQLWKNQLTDYSKYKQGKRFCFLVHSITYHGKVTKENIGERPTISTSLITNRHMQVFGQKFGFIYDLSANNLLLIDKDDCQSYTDSGSFKKINPIEYEKIDDENYLVYSSFDASKTRIPKTLEEYLVRKSKNDVGNKIYNEIILKNDKDTKPLAIFYITNGDKYFSDDYEQVKKFANEFNLEIIEINTSYYKEIKVNKEEKKMILDRLYDRCIREVSYTQDEVFIEKFFTTINLKEDYDRLLFLYKKICRCNSEQKFRKIIMRYIRLWIKWNDIVDKLCKAWRRLNIV